MTLLCARTGKTPFSSYSVQVAALNAVGTGLIDQCRALTVETLQDSELMN